MQKGKVITKADPDAPPWDEARDRKLLAALRKLFEETCPATVVAGDTACENLRPFQDDRHALRPLDAKERAAYEEAYKAAIRAWTSLVLEAIQEDHAPNWISNQIWELIEMRLASEPEGKDVNSAYYCFRSRIEAGVEDTWNRDYLEDLRHASMLLALDGLAEDPPPGELARAHEP